MAFAIAEDDVEAFVPELRTAPGAEETEGSGTLKRRLDHHERQAILDELERSGWNVSAAAKTLGIDRASLHRKMRRHGISRAER